MRDPVGIRTNASSWLLGPMSTELEALSIDANVLGIE